MNVSAHRLTVELGIPASRSMWVGFTDGEQTFGHYFATSVGPYAFLDRLCDTVCGLHEGFVSDRISLLLGAPECDLHFDAEAGSRDAAFRAVIWPDSRRSTLRQPDVVFAYTGSRADIVRPFVKALADLRSRVTDAAFETGYGEPFPSAAFDRLMARSKQKRDA